MKIVDYCRECDEILLKKENGLCFKCKKEKERLNNAKYKSGTNYSNAN